VRPYLSSAGALSIADDRLASEELQCPAVRRQVAVVRALADQLERVPASEAASLRTQLLEELARLRSRYFEAPEEPSTTWPPPESGTFSVRR
jgi:hypothetical protein